MAINWSKYGIDKEDEQENKYASKVNWDNYTPEGMQESYRQRTKANREAFPDLHNPFKMHENLKSTFATPAQTAKPLTKAQEEAKASPLASPLVQLGIQAPNVKVNAALSTMDEVLNNPRRGYDDSFFSPSQKYVEDRLERERESASSNPVMRGINTALEPLSRVVYQLEANMPGVAAFQEGTGQALGVKTFGAPVTGPNAINVPARLVGNLAGGLTNPSNIGQGLVSAPLQAGRGIAQAAANKAPVLGNKFAQRGIEGAVAGGIQGGVISGVRGETDAKELATNIGLGVGLGAAGDLALTGVGSLVRAAGNKAKDAAQGILGQQVKAANAIESASRSVPTNKLKVTSNEQILDRVMTEIKPLVSERMTPPLENPNELAKWLKPYFGDVSLNEVRKLPYEDMQQLAIEVQRNMDMFDTARRVAKEQGHNLDSLLDGGAPTLKQAAERLRVGGVAGAIDPPKNVKVALKNDVFDVSAPANLPTANDPGPLNIGALGKGKQKFTNPEETMTYNQLRTTNTIDSAAPKTQLEKPNKLGKVREVSNEPIMDEVLYTPKESGRGKKNIIEIGGYEHKKTTKDANAFVQETLKYPPHSMGRRLEILVERRKNIDEEISYLNTYATKGEALTEAVQKLTTQRRLITERIELNGGHFKELKLPESSSMPVENIQTNPKLKEVDEILEAIKQPRVRDRIYSYLDDAEKAARERITKRGNRLSSTPFDVWGDHAIIMAAKVGKGTIKAADFTEELVKEFGEQVRPHADRIFRRTKEVLRTQERKASKAGQEADVFNNSGIGDADSFDTKISRQKGKKKTPFAERWEKMRTQFIDDVAPLEGLEKRVTGRVASAEDSLYKSARLFKGTPERAAQTVTDRLAPIVKSVESAGYSSDDLGRYALAKHAQDVNNAGYKSGFTNAEIQDVLNKLSSTEMDAAQQALIKVNKDMMKELVGSGVVSKQLADVLDERWQNYIPLFREFDDDMVEFGGGLSKALANVSDPIKALKGSERAVIDPLENMVKNIFQSINSSERNKVATQLAKLAAKDADGQFIRKLKPDETVGRKNVVNVRIDGESVKFEVEPEVYKAMINLDQESSNMLINVLSKPASLLRAGATLTPEFSLRNPIRDIRQAYVTSNSGFNPITDFGAGLIQSITKGNLYKQWIDNLGGYGNVISQDRNVHRQALEKVLKQPASKKFVNIVNGKGLINLLRAISDTTESATKVGEFRAALRKGQTPQEAAYRSRDIMDFGRAGTSIRQANKVIAFLNANLQGKSKIIRSVKENPIGTTARAFSSVTVPTIAIYAINHSLANETQKQTIAEAPDWQKDTFWLVSIPGTDQVARIPKPFDIAPIFANLPEKALDFVRDNDKEAFDGFIRRTGNDMALPAQLSGLLPFIEGMANYSFFREGSIIPQREQGMDFKDQYDPVRTTETAKALAAAAQKLTGGEGAFKNFSSPRIMDNTIQGLTAGLGTYATSAIDTILKGVGAVKGPVAPEKRLEQRPLAKAFLVDPMQGGKSMEKFYEEKEKLQKQKSSASINEHQFTGDGRLKQLNAVSDVMSKINKRIRDIESSDLTAKQKRDEIDPLIQQRNKLARQAVGGSP